MPSITYLFILRGITNNKLRISTRKTVSVPYFKQPYGVVMVMDGEMPFISFPVSHFSLQHGFYKLFFWVSRAPGEPLMQLL